MHVYLQAISMLPEYVHVGLITFGTHVHVYEIGFTELSKCYVFRGAKEYTPQQVWATWRAGAWSRGDAVSACNASTVYKEQEQGSSCRRGNTAG
jgi:hypothetical protein